MLRRILFILFLCAAIAPLSAELQVVDFKGVDAVIEDPRLAQANPRHGFYWWKQNVIQNIYRYYLPQRTDEDPAYLLTRQLFFLNNDNVNFGVVGNPTTIATYFTPKLVGKLMAAVQVARLTKQYNDPFKKEIIDILLPRAYEEVEGSHAAAAGAGAGASAGAGSAFAASTSEASGSYPRGASLAWLLTQSQEKIAANLQRHLEMEAAKEGKTISTLRTDATSTERIVSSFAHWLQQAVKQDEREPNTFVPFYPERLLTGFLCAKGDGRADLNAYFEGFFGYLQEQLKVINKCLKKDKLVMPEAIALLDPTERFMQADFGSVRFSGDVAKNAATLASPEGRLLAQFGAEYFEHKSPLKIRYQFICYDKVFFANCVEIALLNFLSTLIYNPATREYDLGLLAALKPSPQLIDFFTHFRNPAAMQGFAAQELFVGLVENLDDVAYARVGQTGKRCELWGNLGEVKGKENLEKVLAAITGYSTFEAAATAVTGHGTKRVTIEPFDQERDCILRYCVTERGLDGTAIPLEYSIDMSGNHFDCRFPDVKQFNDVQSRALFPLCSATDCIAELTDEDFIRAASLAPSRSYAMPSWRLLTKGLLVGASKIYLFAYPWSFDDFIKDASAESVTLLSNFVVQFYAQHPDDVNFPKHFFYKVSGLPELRPLLAVILREEKFQKSYIAKARLMESILKTINSSFDVQCPTFVFDVSRVEGLDGFIDTFFDTDKTLLQNAEVTVKLLEKLLLSHGEDWWRYGPHNEVLTSQVIQWIIRATRFLAHHSIYLDGVLRKLFKTQSFRPDGSFFEQFNGLLKELPQETNFNELLELFRGMNDGTLLILKEGLLAIKENAEKGFYVQDYVNVYGNAISNSPNENLVKSVNRFLARAQAAATAGVVHDDAAPRLDARSAEEPVAAAGGAGYAGAGY